MAIITVTITESSIELVSGRPKFVTLAANVAATIFYTFDGSDPDTSSAIYLGGELDLPTNPATLIFKVFATDGTDSSAIIEREYRPDIIEGRVSHDIVTTTDEGCNDNFPYATHGPGITGQWLNVGPEDAIVDKDGGPTLFDGYDGTATGTTTGGTDLPLDEYLIRFSERNSRGEGGRGIGTMPSTTTVVLESAPAQSSNMNDKLFDPRAMVIYQDSREEPFDPNILQINRAQFSLENPEKVKDGILLDTLAIEGAPTPTGSLVRAHYNPRENTTTYYRFDSQALRWIISIEPGVAQNPREGLSRIVFSSRRPGASKVFQWVLFKGSRLV
jgi:hypothetical protein